MNMYRNEIEFLNIIRLKIYIYNTCSYTLKFKYGFMQVLLLTEYLTSIC